MTVLPLILLAHENTVLQPILHQFTACFQTRFTFQKLSGEFKICHWNEEAVENPAATEEPKLRQIVLALLEEICLKLSEFSILKPTNFLGSGTPVSESIPLAAM